MLLSDLVAQQVRSSKDKTCESYRTLLSNLRLFCGQTPVVQCLTPERCSQFASWLLQRVMPSSAKLYLSLLRTLLRLAQSRGLYPHDTEAWDLPRVLPKEPLFLTIEEVRRLERAPCPHASTKQAFLFAVHTGLRLSDIETLEWQHIVSRGNECFVVKEQVKTGRMVRVPLDKQALALLRMQTPASDRVFSLLSRTTIATDLRQWAAAAGLSCRLTFHASRHTFVALSLQARVEIYTVSRLCGHANVTTTQRYAHLVDDVYTAAVRSMNHLWKCVQRE
mgnify:FL=1